MPIVGHYNLTQLGNTGNFTGIIRYVNDATNGIAVGGIMTVLFFIIALMNMRFLNPLESTMISALICCTLSVILVTMSVLTAWWIVVFLAVAGGSWLLNYYMNK